MVATLAEQHFVAQQLSVLSWCLSPAFYHLAQCSRSILALLLQYPLNTDAFRGYYPHMLHLLHVHLSLLSVLARYAQLHLKQPIKACLIRTATGYGMKLQRH